MNLFPIKPRKISLYQADLEYYENLFGEESSLLFEKLKNTILWKEEEIFIFGKKYFQPRLIAWYGDRDCKYSYSGKEYIPIEWTNDLIHIKQKVESRIKEKFNSVLLNYYRNGNDSMGWHSDDEIELGDNPIIASLSFGVTRKFFLKHKNEKSLKTFQIELADDTLLVMKGTTQKYWLHSVPKSKKILSARINLTFRNIITGYKK